MFNFNAHNAPLIRLVGCPACRLLESEQGQVIINQQNILCQKHAARWLAMLNDPDADQHSVYHWLSFLPVKTRKEA